MARRAPRISPEATSRSPVIRAGATPRAILLALLLAVVNDYWIVQLEVVRYSFPTYAAPFYNCVFTLLVVTAANLLVRARFPRAALSQGELITVYVMLSITSAVCSHNMMEILVSLMGYAHYFSTPANKWGALFADRLPGWLTVRDSVSLSNLYGGRSSLYDPVNYTPWVVPVLCWSAFCAVLLFTLLCINSIMRKQWVEAERLTFPVIQLPFEMTQDSGALFRNRHMWLGFAIAGSVTLLAGVSYLYPSVPYLRIVRRDIGAYITHPPWNAMGLIPMGLYFWAIGIAFLMPLELSFSCWLFYWALKMELVATEALGLRQLPVAGGGFDRSYPFINSQAYGAYLAFFVMSMIVSRRYLGRVLRTAFLGTKEVDESGEAMSYRAAILGALAGFFLLGAFAYRMGMSVAVIVTFFLFYFIFALIISRIRAELGFPTHDMHIMPPQNLIMTAVGTEQLPPANLVGFSLFYWFNRTYASHPSPHCLEALKLGERTEVPARQMFRGALIAGVFAMPIGFWMLLHHYFKLGGATAKMEQWALGFGRETWVALAGWMQNPFPPNTLSLFFVGAGFLFALLLGWLRIQFLWFPLHPLAYALANSWGVSQLWMPLLIGSSAKFLVFRAGGLSLYRKAVPFFLGLILGEITVGSLWTIIGVVIGIPTYDFWPGRYG
ncbi:MAG: hypothetical protein JSV65_12325 [Armatimonadota bacterium]|nr:MAG: hypothetical protein JSV65_12325 [Armatimonadota bacterium]